MRICYTKRMIIGVDIGGTKTLVAEFNDEGKLGHMVKFPTPKNPEDFFTQITQTIDKNFSDFTAISVASPGIIHEGTVVVSPNLKQWRNVHIVDRFKTHVKKPVYLENDAKMAALAEASQLEYRNKLCVYLTLSTGIGIGVVFDGKLVKNLNQSEAGHIILEEEGKLQEWENFASGRAIKAKYGKFASEINDPGTWQEISQNIVAGLAVIIPIIVPDVIIIGGSIGTYFDRYEKFVTELLDTQLPAMIKRPKLVQAKHPEEAVIYGCYQNAINHQSA